MIPLAESILVRAGRQKVGSPTAENAVGASASSVRSLIETNTANVVYVNFTTGNDSTGDGTSGNPYKTYAKGATDVGTGTITTLEWMTNDPLPTVLTVPTQVSVGVIGVHRPHTNFTLSNGSISAAVVGIETDTLGNWVVGGNGAMYYSPDGGQTWTAATSSGPMTSNVNDIATDRLGNWVAVGGTGSANAIGLSTDNGDTWVAPTDKTAFTDQIACVTTDRAGVWVALDFSGTAAYSTDNGDTWTAATTSPTMTPRGIATDTQGNWVTVGDSKAVYISTDDGDTWTAASDVSAFPALTALYDIATDENGQWAVVTSGVSGYSTDNGDTWTASTTGLGGSSSGICYDSVNDVFYGANRYSIDGGDNWIQVSGFTISNGCRAGKYGDVVHCATGGGGAYIYRSAMDIQKHVCGIDFASRRLEFSNSVTMTACSSNNDLSIIESLPATISKCYFDINLLDITNNTASISDSVIIGNVDLDGTGTGVTVTQSTIIGNLTFDNSGGTGTEIFRDCILEGNLTGTETTNLMTMESGNIRGTATDVLIASGSVSSVNPLFVDYTLPYDLRLQVESGYPDTTTFDFDSPLVEASKFGTTSNGAPRDYGAYNFDHTTTSYAYSRAHYLPKPSTAGAIRFSRRFIAQLLVGLSGEPDVNNQVDRRLDTLSITYANLSAEHQAFIEFIESNRDTTCFIAVDPNLFISLPNLVANGAHSIGSVVITIDSATVPAGSVITIGSLKYHVVYGVDSGLEKSVTGVTKIVLDRPVESAIADNDEFVINSPIGTGEYKYLPPQEKVWTRNTNIDTEHARGISITFVRKTPSGS